MRLVSLLTILLALSPPLAAIAQQTAPPPPAVKVGQQAPDFTLHYLARGADGKYEQKTVSLADFKGQKTVILAFFPAAFSPG
jgi:AhpC/TSA family